MSYFFKFIDISDSANESLGTVERTAAIVKRHYIGDGVITEATVFHINFYFEDWNSDEILAADRLEVDRGECVGNDFWNVFGGDVDTVLMNLLNIARQRKEEWNHEHFHEDNPLYVKII